MNNDQLNEARIFYLAAQAITPLIERMHATAYDTMLSRYRLGQKDLLAEIARVESLATLLEEIRTKIQTYETHAKNKE